MAKARFVFLGIVCVLLVTLTSISVAYASYPAFPDRCIYSPAFQLMGTRIRLWPYGPVTTRVLANGWSYVMHGTYLDEWSTRTAAEKSRLYSAKSYFKLWIDGKPVPLSVDICYSALDDSGNKMFYVQFHPYQWKPGPHTFRAVWSSITGTEPRYVGTTVVVTFSYP